MNCITLLLVKLQNDNLEANIWIISTIEWQQHSSVYVQESGGKLKAKGLLFLFTSTKGVYQLLRLLVHIQWHGKGWTRHHIHFCISILWYGQGNYYGSTWVAYQSYCYSELWPKQLRDLIYNRCKVVHLCVGKEAGQLFEEVLHIHPTCYSMLHNMYTWCLMSAYSQWK